MAIESAPRFGGPAIFSLSDWEQWADRIAGALFDLSSAEFEARRRNGEFSDSGPARDLESALVWIHGLRLSTECVESGPDSRRVA